MTLMEQDVESMAGPKGKHDPERIAYRHGTQSTTVPMGNQRSLKFGGTECSWEIPKQAQLFFIMAIAIGHQWSGNLW